MLAVRYAALAALVVWLGGIASIELLGDAVDLDVIRRFQIVAATCGGVLFISLVAIKFVGPPPHGFFARITLVTIMLAMGIYSLIAHQAARTLMPITLLCGSGLLYWYVKE